ncbi:hypothetical protein SARC_15019 [Sphaeroforma arctica JP610]|uniref:Uncharacterized protein n=1 Tax=Sphaeroforma arctica JP610 TaxID=667725 RepID=A0A0L0F8I9_9EUKA|nr:hypothetical protein SARC_15019 [Sphaeroforma arctica JP610]KNC72423.1 hypothetical protein SARC_15019 [Sphaeroforma arctica JP610]|eukprot:XP_014146325.1 hypothetical protein SARC_15019 [Sphaeroforma arctica JP610]
MTGISANIRSGSRMKSDSIESGTPDFAYILSLFESFSREVHAKNKAASLVFGADDGTDKARFEGNEWTEWAMNSAEMDRNTSHFLGVVSILIYKSSDTYMCVLLSS